MTIRCPNTLRLPLQIVVAVILLAGCTAACADGHAEQAVQPDIAEMFAAQQQIQKHLRRAPTPDDLQLVEGTVPWLTGNPQAWTDNVTEVVLRWVAEGNICWIDLAVASAFGLRRHIAGGTNTAVVAEEGRQHPLAAGVDEIRAPDTFGYIVELPENAIPIFVGHNRDKNAVVGVWPVGDGFVILRPPKRRSSCNWRHRGERRWIAINLADGRRLRHNLNVFTMNVLNDTPAK